ncbi:Chromosome partition protein Smc [Carpediemonas membranifera]|uniref:Chromosome partition protein Smc n=1 Tax=Carpediemonas membranifera TaxID=201153 RepID=A0A8J6AWI1_9EUKA|nr:Chromosome partition protein Smc [Carpediemonas membranifera]|eukprot:KAG9390048.1 Chromosome partition protein Smc [Carpediemonas membranifera]
MHTSETDSGEIVSLIGERSYSASSMSCSPALPLIRASHVSKGVSRLVEANMASLIHGFSTTNIAFGHKSSGRTSFLLADQFHQHSVFEDVAAAIFDSVEEGETVGISCADVPTTAIRDVLVGGDAVAAIHDLAIIEATNLTEVFAAVQAGRAASKASSSMAAPTLTALAVRISWFRPEGVTTADFIEIPGTCSEADQLERTQRSQSYSPLEINAKRSAHSFARGMNELIEVCKKGKAAQSARLSQTVPSVRDNAVCRAVFPMVTSTVVHIVGFVTPGENSFSSVKSTVKLLMDSRSIESPVLKSTMNLDRFIRAGGVVLSLDDAVGKIERALAASPSTASHFSQSRASSRAPSPATSRLRQSIRSSRFAETEAGSEFGRSRADDTAYPSVRRPTDQGRRDSAPAMPTNGFHIGQRELTESVRVENFGASRTDVDVDARHSVYVSGPGDEAVSRPNWVVTESQISDRLNASRSRVSEYMDQSELSQIPETVEVELRHLRESAALKDETIRLLKAELGRLSQQQVEEHSRVTTENDAQRSAMARPQKYTGFISDPRPPTAARTVTANLRRDLKRKEAAIMRLTAELSMAQDETKGIDQLRARLRQAERVAADRRTQIEGLEEELITARRMVKIAEQNQQAADSELASMAQELSRVKAEMQQTKAECKLIRSQSKLQSTSGHTSATSSPSIGSTGRSADFPVARDMPARSWGRGDIAELDDLHQTLREKLAGLRGH